MSSSHGAAASAERLRGPLSRVPATAKLVGLVAFLLVVGLTPNHAAMVLAAWLAVAAGAAAVAFVEWRAVARRLVLDVPLVALAVAQALFGHGPHVSVAGVELSRPGLEVGLAVLAKATTGVVAVSAVAASTTVPQVLDAMARLGLPAWFCRMMALSARQVDVLRSELDRLRLAAALRAPGGGRRATWSVGARSLGSLVVRTAERADRLQLAADLRGGADAQHPDTRTSRTSPAGAPRSVDVVLDGERDGGASSGPRMTTEGPATPHHHGESATSGCGARPASGATFAGHGAPANPVGSEVAT